MSSFQGGPADGVSLMLRNAPLLLRVTFNPRAKERQWDALDLPEDVPKGHEQLHLYVRVSEPFPYNVSARGKGASEMVGVWTRADYRYAPYQPEDAILRYPRPWELFVQGYERDVK